MLAVSYAAGIIQTVDNLKHARIGHVHLKVRMLDRSIEFYRSVFGMQMTERVGTFAFLSFGNAHHDIALNEVGSDAKSPRSEDVGLYHFAVELMDIDQLRSLRDRLGSLRVSFSAVNHGISKAVYFEDPDGNGIEVYVDTRDSLGKKQWQGQSTTWE